MKRRVLTGSRRVDHFHWSRPRSLVFDDLDNTLKALLDRELALRPDPGPSVTVTFGTPGDVRAAASWPALNLFLCDIVENRDLRTGDLRGADPSGAPAPVRVDCHYLVTAWAQPSAHSVLVEHRVLGLALGILLAYPIIPADVLQGVMSKQPFPVRAAAIRTDTPRVRGDFWHALGDKPRASFDYRVTISATPDLAAPASVPVVEQVVLQMTQVVVGGPLPAEPTNQE